MSQSEDNLRDILYEDKIRNGHVVKGHRVATSDTDLRFPRMAIDFRIPLWSLFVAAVGLGGILINMWMTLVSVSSDMSSMRESMKQVVQANTQLIKDQSLLQYRVEKLEAERHVR